MGTTSPHTGRSGYQCDALEPRRLLAVFTVTDPFDAGGVSSLRFAIQSANVTQGPDEIHFNIPGTGPHTISVGSELPDITDTLLIDGYTQPGSSPNTLEAGSNAVWQIRLDGSQAGGPAGQSEGLSFASAAGGSVVRGLLIRGFSGPGISVFADNVKVQGNFIGPDGPLANGNAVGIYVRNRLCEIGGITPQDRNVISGNQSSGVSIESLSAVVQDALVRGNLIGTAANGIDDLGNGANGIVLINSRGNLIGGTDSAARNIISGNGENGVSLLLTKDTRVLGNSIGVGVTGQPLLNSNHGVEINNVIQEPSTFDNVIGGPTAAEANIIAFNGADGVSVLGAAVQNEIRGNSIFSNIELGIDLENDGVTLNDPPNELDADDGANNLQNFPEIILLEHDGPQTHIKGELDSRAFKTYLIDFYGNDAPDPSGHGEGKYYLGQTTVVTDGDGHAEFDLMLPPTTAHCISTTATDDDLRDTSEFSPCVAFPNLRIWTGTAGNGSWTTTTNWMGDEVPSLGETAVIPGDGPPVTISGVANANSVISDRPVIILFGGTLNVVEGSHFSSLDVQQGGTIAMDGTNTVTDSYILAGSQNAQSGIAKMVVPDSFLWSGGNLSGTTIMGLRSLLTLTTTGNHNLNGNLATEGEIVWNEGPINLFGSAAIEVKPDGKMIANAAAGETLTISGHGSNNALNISGTFEKKGPGTVKTTTFGTQAAVNNFSPNSLIVEEGTFLIDAGGSSSGHIEVHAGANLTIDTFGYNFLPGWSITGEGTVNLDGGTVNFATGTLPASLTVNLTNGSLAGSGELSIPAELNWTGGSMAGTGKTIIPSGAQLNLAGVNKILSRTLDLGGEANWTAGSFFGSGGTFNVLTGATFTADTSGTLSASGINAGGAFNNAGDFIKRGTGAVSFIGSSGPMTFNNTSPNSVTVENGTLTLSGGGASMGHFDVQASGILSITSAYTFSAGWSITGSGAVNISGGTVNFATGTIAAPITVNHSNGTIAGSGDLSIAGTLNWTGGFMSGTGKTKIPTAGVLNLSGGSRILQRTLEVAGMCNWTAGNISVQNGGTINVLAGGVFNVTTATTLAVNAGDGAFNNAGTLNKLGVGTLQFNAGSGPLPFNNSGKVDVQAGTISFGGGFIQPASATTAQIILNGGLISLPLSIAGGAFIANSDPSGLALTVGDAATAAFNISSRLAAFVLNGGVGTLATNGSRVLTVTSIAVTGDGQLDLTNNAMVVNYTSPSPIQTVRSLLTSGRNTKLWTGNGIRSSIAAATAGTSLGFGESSAILGPSGGDFAGQSVDGTAVLIRYTRDGDSDLDRDVDLSDLGNMATNFGATSGKLWNNGDFDFDGDVDLNDLGTLATYFGTTLVIEKTSRRPVTSRNLLAL